MTRQIDEVCTANAALETIISLTRLIINDDKLCEKNEITQ